MRHFMFLVNQGHVSEDVELVIGRGRNDVDVIHLECRRCRSLKISYSLIVIRLGTDLGVASISQSILALEQKERRRFARLEEFAFSLELDLSVLTGTPRGKNSLAGGLDRLNGVPDFDNDYLLLLTGQRL